MRRFFSWQKRRWTQKHVKNCKDNHNQEPVIDEFLYYYQQYRPKNAMPDGWLLSKSSALEECLSRDSGRSSGLESIEDGSSQLVYEQPSKPLITEDKDSGVSSLPIFDDHHHPEDFWEPDFNSNPSFIAVQQQQNHSLLEEHQTTSWLKIVTLILLLVSFLATFPFWIESNASLNKPFDVETFKKASKDRVFGQEFAVQSIIHLLNDFNELKNYEEVQVLVLAGSSGTGKSLLSQLIAETFTYQSHRNVLHYQDLIHHIVAQHHQPSLFIVEDVTDLHFWNDLSRVKARNPTLVVVTTRLGSENLNSKVMEWLKMARNMHEIHSVIKSQLYQDLKAQIRTKNLNLIPLLPLTRKHLKQCILKEAPFLSTKESQWIVNQMAFFSPTFPVFSVKGCQPVGKLVELLAVMKKQQHAMS